MLPLLTGVEISRFLGEEFPAVFGVSTIIDPVAFGCPMLIPVGSSTYVITENTVSIC